MCLIAQLLNDGFDLSVALSDHFFTDLSLSLDMLVLSFLKQVTFKFILLDHQLLFHLLNLILMSSLEVFNLFFALFALVADLIRGTCLYGLNFFLQAIILHLEHLLNSRILIEDSVLPSLPFVRKLRFETFVLLVKLGLTAFALLINSFLFLVA